ncbi:MAG TPA: cell envelope integrity protein TolA [Steroidobacteraceae bacterium]|nr:cell envelope integrity protein TolA [Steroidobacteraceae bacterium]
MVQRASDRWISIALSLLLHGALLAALVYGWWFFREQRRAPPTPPIAATVIDARTLKGLEQPAPQPAAAPKPPPPPEDVGPPQPTPEERAAREQAEQARRQAEEQKAAQERAAAERAAAEKEAADRAVEKAVAKAAAAKAAADKAAAKAAAERARQDEADRREREADLKRSLAAEEHADVARNGAALASWESMIAAKINRAWLRPPTAKAGIDCMLNVTQVPGGEVTQVSIGQCNGDQAVRESIEAAVYRASPLPPPPDPALFDRNLKIDFKPD